MRGWQVSRKGTWAAAIVLAASALPCALRAQDKPLSVTGTFATGYYSTDTRGEANQSMNFVPVGARFDISGYLLSRDMLELSAEPELTLGPQASEAGFQGGNGATLRATLLRRSVSPLTFTYSNVQLEDIYFGSLTQLSGYTLKNRNRNLGLTWQLKLAHLPLTIVDWGTNSVDSRAGIVGVPDYLSRGNHVNVDTKDDRWGWNLEGFVHRERQQSDLLTSLDGKPGGGALVQTVTQYQVSGRRSFWKDSELYLEGGRQSTGSLLITLPVDLTTHYSNANLRLFQKRRWKTSLRAGYSSNLSSQLLAQATGALTQPGSAVPDGYLLQPFSRSLANFNLNGLTTVTIGGGWGAYGGVERNAILSSSQDGPFNANYFTTSAGVTYARGFGWGNLNGEYGREFGLGSITGQSGTIQGQTYRFSAQRGKTGGLVVDATVRGSDQDIRNTQPVTNRSSAAEGNVSARVAGNLSVRVGGGWQWGSLVNQANEFRTNGYTARAGIEHPRFQLGVSLNDTLSDSLPFFDQAAANLGLGSALLGPVQPVPGDYRATSFTLHAIPLRKVEITALWTSSKQHLGGILNNDFQLLNIGITYHFRRIQIEAGFIRSNQIFDSYPDTMRQRLYVRIVRNARLL